MFLNNALVAYGEDATLTGGTVGLVASQGAQLSVFSASALTPAAPTLTASTPFTDTFSTTFTLPTTPPTSLPNQLDNNWINQAGNFSVSTSNGTATGAAAYDLATVVGINAANVAVQASIALATTGEAAGLVANYSGSGDGSYYFGSLQATGANTYQANLYRVVNGNYTLLFTQTATGSVNGTLQLTVYDGSLQLFLNGNLVAYGNDATLTGGSVGIRTNMGATLSNFST